VTASSQTTGGIVYTFSSYSYKPNDGLSQITYPSGRQVNYTYTGAGRVATVSGLMSGNNTNYANLSAQNSYTPHGAIASMILNNGLLTETTTYNPRLQPTQIQVPGLLTLVYDFGTTQNNGNLQSQTIIRGSQTWTQIYPNTCYDKVNRLTCASESGSGSWSQSYGYDNFGNRWVPPGSTGLPSPSNEVPNGSNWYLSNNRISGWGYDLSGNITSIQNMPRSFEYDAENRQTKATVNSVATTYTYDGEGRRVTKTWNGQTTTFVYDASGNLAAEYGGPGGDTGTQYLTSDHLGSTRLVTDSTGAAVKCYDYLPFGEEIGNGTAGRGSCFGSGSYPVAGGATNREFTSKERDAETGLDFFESRYYSSAQGRFTSPDEFKGGFLDAFSGHAVFQPGPLPYADITDPQTLNKYAYVRNNPLRYTDPDGHCVEDFCVVEGGVALAAGSSAELSCAEWVAGDVGLTGAALTLHNGANTINSGIRSLENAISGLIFSKGNDAESTGSKEPPQLQAGKKAHQDEEVRQGEKAEVPTPSGKGRMDRYDAEKGHIREIKPDNPRGVRAGEKQLERYKGEMENATGRQHTTELTKYPPPKLPKLPDQP
jgi:RHS repeat-associated protein